ncbi:MAG: 40S ribosomal protein [Candelina submexicana]|nr:MAG: 40S ribosomal protein [Candelina submexicana]
MAAMNKIAATSPSRQSPSEIETSIANALYDLETNIPDMKGALRPLQFVSARERGVWWQAMAVLGSVGTLERSQHAERHNSSTDVGNLRKTLS